jgi:ABC-type multidrug transport system permease subunit
MKLTYRDGMATVLAGAAGLVALANAQAWDWPLLSNPRWAIGALLVIGMLMCSTGSAPDTYSRPDAFTWMAGALGVVALGLVIYGFVVGTVLAVVALATVIVGLWFVATIHHLVGPIGSTPRLAA